MPSDCLQVTQCNPAQLAYGSRGLTLELLGSHHSLVSPGLSLGASGAWSSSLWESVSKPISLTPVSAFSNPSPMCPLGAKYKSGHGALLFQCVQYLSTSSGMNLNLSLGQKRKNKNVPFAVAFAYRTHRQLIEPQTSHCPFVASWFFSCCFLYLECPFFLSVPTETSTCPHASSRAQITDKPPFVASPSLPHAALHGAHPEAWQCDGRGVFSSSVRVSCPPRT